MLNPFLGRLLIVDDEKMIYSVLAQRLAKEGYACMMANNGRQFDPQILEIFLNEKTYQRQWIS